MLFDSGDLFAFRHNGGQLWHVDFNTRYGQLLGGHDFGSSLRQAGGRLYAHISQAKPGYLVAIRKEDGSAVWKEEMPAEGGYGTPLAARVDGRDLLLVSTQGGVAAHDLETGKQVWKNVQEGGRGGIPSLSMSNDTVVASSAEKGKSFALRLDAPLEKAWTARVSATPYSSPLLHEGRAYFALTVQNLFRDNEKVLSGDGSRFWRVLVTLQAGSNSLVDSVALRNTGPKQAHRTPPVYATTSA